MLVLIIIVLITSCVSITVFGKLGRTIDRIFRIFILIRIVSDKVNVSLSNSEYKSLNGLLEISSTAFRLRLLLIFCQLKVLSSSLLCL